jgi:hypothetical protein
VSGPEFAGSAMSVLDGILQTIREVQERITRIENEERRVKEQRAVSDEFFGRKHKDDSNE